MPVLQMVPNFDTSGTGGVENPGEWSERWTAIMSSPLDPWREVFEQFPEFAPGRPHPEIPLAYHQTFNVNNVNDAPAYEFDFKYKIYTPENLKPLDREVKVEWESIEVEEPVIVDINKKPLLNTAGELLRGITAAKTLYELKFTRNEPSVPPWILRFPNAINEDAVKIDGLTFPATTLQFKKLRVSSRQGDAVTGFYRSVSYSLFYNPDTWLTQVINQGLSEIVVTEDRVGKKHAKAVRILDDETGEAITEPVPLDREGKRPRDKDGVIITNLEPDDIVILKFNTKNRIAFRSIAS